MTTYIVKFQKTGSSFVTHMTVKASSASQAKEQVKQDIMAMLPLFLVWNVNFIGENYV